jgi:hypothetical protein
VFGAHDRTDHISEASPLEEWLGREPMPEDLRGEQPPVDPN